MISPTNDELREQILACIRQAEIILHPPKGEIWLSDVTQLCAELRVAACQAEMLRSRARGVPDPKIG